MMTTLLLLISTLLLKTPLHTIMMLTSAMLMMSLYLYSPMSTPTCPNSTLLVDHMSVMLIILLLWTLMLMFLSSSKLLNKLEMPKLFSILMTLLAFILSMAFMMNNIFMFYMFFEASLIPTLMLIIIWGYQPERLRAGMYLLLYTVTASLPFLLTITLLFKTSKSTLLILSPQLSSLSPLTYSMLLIAMLVKLPMYLLHIWLPKAHVEAPVAGSMILASILLKLGAYGLIRLNSITPLMTKMWAPALMSISLWGALITSIACIQQPDLKALIAYSSVSHMALVIVGLSSNSLWGHSGSVMMMMAHGLSSSGLFALANMQYDNSHTRSMFLNKGTMSMTPFMTLGWFLLLMANMGAPPTLNLLSEMFLLSSAFMYTQISLLLLPLLAIFTVVYSIMLFTNMHHGPTPTTMKFSHPLSNNYTVMFLHIYPTFALLLSSSLFIME